MGTEMTLKFYTLRGKTSGRLYYATGHTYLQACREIKIPPRLLILERSELMPAQGQLDTIVPIPHRPVT